MAALLREIGVALIVAFMAGAVFLFGQLVYAQVVLMPRVVATGSNVLAVSVDVWWALRVTGVTFAVYLTWRLWPRGGRG